MTVSAKTPLAEYTGNGTTSRFDWDWEMIEDSSIEVLIDNARTADWTLEGQSVVFFVPPADGAFIQIYRRTKVWMPEDYVAFGRFHPDKTELSVDRATMIAAEYKSGMVGRSDLTTTHHEFYVAVHSERGKDAHVPMYAPDATPPPTPVVPDPSIVWAGEEIDLNTIGEGANGLSAALTFVMDSTATYPDNNVLQPIQWVDLDPNDGDYWMRVTKINSNRPVLINDGVSPRELGEAFPIATGPYISIDTFGEPPPKVATASVTVEICKDDGGLPDGGWVSRTVNMEVRFNLEGEVEPPPPDPEIPPDLDGAISWDSFFGAPFGTTSLTVERIIATEGVAIWFTVPVEPLRIWVKFSTIEVATVETARNGAVNTTVLDFDTPPTFTWGLGGGINGWINPDPGDIGANDLELVQGNTYILNLRNNPIVSPNWIRVQTHYREP